MKYSIEEGLPTSNIYSVLEDDKGLIWFATDVGVLRYNGYEFTHFNTDDGLGDNEVFRIFQDSSGRLWFLTLNGKLSYYEDGNFRNGINDTILRSLSHSSIIMDIMEDEKGTIHILYGDGLTAHLNRNNEIDIADYSDSKGYGYWIIGDTSYVLGREFIINLESKEQVYIRKEDFTDGSYRSCIGPGGQYYFSSSTGIFEYSGGQDYKKFYEIPDTHYDIINLSIIEDDFWIGTRAGLLKLTEGEVQSYFDGDIVSSVMKDSQENYWVTTLNDGVKFVPNLFVANPSLDGGNYRVNALQSEAGDTLWIGTDKGLYTLTTGDKLPRIVEGFQDQKVKRIRKFDNRTLFLGKMMHVRDGSSWSKYAFTSNDILIREDSIIFANSNYTGMMSEARYNYVLNTNRPRIAQETIKGSILPKRSNVLVQGNRSTYIGTSTGLYERVNSELKKLITFNGELETSILDLCYDSLRDQLIVGSNSKGVIVLNGDTVVHHITTENGLNSNGANCIEQFSESSYFIGTNNGLNLLTIEEDSISMMDYNVLLKTKGERINDIQVVDDVVYLATESGLQYFSPKLLVRARALPKLTIDRITINGEERTIDGPLEHFENSMSVYYTGISYADYGKLTYEYKLNDETYWTSTQIRQIDFKNLPNADYTLSIRALSSSGDYSEIEELDFTIAAPFWKTTPFIVLVILLGAILIYFIVSRAIKTIKDKFELERNALQTEQERALLQKKTIELEQKALRLQMNPHFIFNTLNTIKGFYSGGDIKDANLYISRFSKLLRLILENDMQLISLQTEIEMLELYIKLIQLRYQDVFDFEIKIDNEINAGEIGIPPMLLQPIVENAIIHGLAPANRKGNLHVEFSREEAKLKCVIQDDGVGIHSKLNGSKHHESKGIAITRERVKFTNDSSDDANFEVLSRSGRTGTEVIIRIPLNKYW